MLHWLRFIAAAPISSPSLTRHWHWKVKNWHWPLGQGSLPSAKCPILGQRTLWAQEGKARVQGIRYNPCVVSQVGFLTQWRNITGRIASTTHSSKLCFVFKLNCHLWTPPFFCSVTNFIAYNWPVIQAIMWRSLPLTFIWFESIKQPGTCSISTWFHFFA